MFATAFAKVEGELAEIKDVAHGVHNAGAVAGNAARKRGAVRDIAAEDDLALELLEGGSDVEERIPFRVGMDAVVHGPVDVTEARVTGDGGGAKLTFVDADKVFDPAKVYR